MTKYFFHVRTDTEFYEDPEGSEFDNLDAARAAALVSAKELFGEKLRAGEVPDESQFEICDEAGYMLDVVPFKNAV